VTLRRLLLWGTGAPAPNACKTLRRLGKPRPLGRDQVRCSASSPIKHEQNGRKNMRHKGADPDLRKNVT
jgi:hypothetical protein